jgi:hypothetical protein
MNDDTPRYIRKEIIRRLCRIELDRKLLVRVLRHAKIVFPDNAQIAIRVPGGGDWSHTDLDVGRESPLFIAWEEEDSRPNLEQSDDVP